VSSTIVTGPSFTSATCIHALTAKHLADALVERLGDQRRCGCGEAGPVPFRGVGEKRELADDEDVAPHVDEGAVEAALPVLEDAQARDPAGEPIRLRLPVAVRDAEEHEEPAAAAPADLPVDADLRLGNPLDHRPHEGRIVPHLRDGGCR
jgi:hypothetical protein